jgi:hypothetical protein
MIPSLRRHLDRFFSGRTTYTSMQINGVDKAKRTQREALSSHVHACDSYCWGPVSEEDCILPRRLQPWLMGRMRYRNEARDPRMKKSEIR